MIRLRRSGPYAASTLRPAACGLGLELRVASPTANATPPVAARVPKVALKVVAASRNPQSPAPAICPTLVTAFRRPSSTPRFPVSSLAMAQVAGQTGAGAGMSPPGPARSTQNPFASINQGAAPAIPQQ